MKYIFIILLLFISTSTLFAQDEIIENVPENTVTIFKDPRLDILEKRPTLMAKLELESKVRKTDERVLPANTTVIDAPIKLGKKLITGSIVTKSGFRVVIYNGSDRVAAMTAKNNFMRSFPSVRSYMTYNAPSYKIKTGDFETKKEASNFLKRVSGSFPTSFIAPDIVTVKNINIIRE